MSKFRSVYDPGDALIAGDVAALETKFPITAPDIDDATEIAIAAPAVAAADAAQSDADDALSELSNMTGTVLLWTATTAPTGFLLCDGSAVSRTTYSDLWNIIGVQFGAGNGTTTFNVPDMRDKFPLGASTLGNPLGSTGGSTGHTHTLSSLGWAKWTYGFWRAVIASSWTPTNTNNATGGAASTNQTVGIELGGATDIGSNMPPYVAMHFVIKF